MAATKILNMLQEQNYWLTTVEMPRPLRHSHCRKALTLPSSAPDSPASPPHSHLAKRGAKVVVLESETIGWGASSRNGGMVLTGHEAGRQQTHLDVRTRTYAPHVRRFA